MAALTLADYYRMANLSPGPDIIKLRSEPVKKAAADLKGQRAVDVARLYFGMPNRESDVWFSELFHDADASFSLIENEREVSVLASAVLGQAVSSGSTHATLTLLAMSAVGLRTPPECPEVLAQARQHELSDSIDRRGVELQAASTIKQPAKSKASAAIAAAIENPEWTKLGEVLKQISDEGAKNGETLASQTAAVLGPLINATNDLREEVQILWWYIGGWSRELNKPFSDFPAETAAVLAGIDMAVLSRTLVAPAASIVLLEKTIAQGRKKVSEKASFHSIVKGLSGTQLAAIALPEAINSNAETCPLLTALIKAREIGGPNAWHISFEKSTGLSPLAELSPIALAVQALRERLVLYSL